jgi:hypothetical protein
MKKTVKDAYSEILRLRNEFYQKWQETSQYDDNRGAYKAKYEAFDKALELLTPSIVDSQPEETVSEDMEKAAKVYEQTRNDLDVVSDNQMVERAFQAGAKWQRQQMMKNALKCVIAKDSQDFQSEGHTIKNGVLNMTDEELRTWWFERPSCYNCANKGKRVASNNNHCVCKIDNEIHNYNDRCKHHSKE